MLVLGFPEYIFQSQALAERLSLPWALVETHRFPDGESRVRLPAELPAEVILCRSLDHPNSKLIELLFTAKTARHLGARHLTLVAPYLCYMRQDSAFRPGEAVSQRVLGELLAQLFDTVITVDPHLHRTHHLSEAVPAGRVLALSAAHQMEGFLEKQPRPFLLIGPDQEAAQWVEAIARPLGLPHAVATKQRDGDCAVRIILPGQSYGGQRIVVIDDVASTGCTLAEIGHALYATGAACVDVLVTHALFGVGSLERLHQAGIQNIWSTDSIAHTTNVIALADLLATGIKQIQTD